MLLYHRVHPEFDPASIPLPPEFFQAHLDELQSHFRVLPLAELVDRHLQGKSLRRCCALTFDDGYADFLTHAVPRLSGLPATNFLVLDALLSGRPLWNYRARAAQIPHGELGVLAPEVRESMLPQARVPMIGPEQARKAPDHITWGSHTRTHSWLSDLPDDRLGWELSRVELGESLGVDVDLVSYPNDRWNARVCQAARAAGYRAGFAVGDRRIEPGQDPFCLPRFDVGALWGAFLRLEILGVLSRLRRLA